MEQPLSLILKSAIYSLLIILLSGRIYGQEEGGVKFINAVHFKMLGKSCVSDSVQFHRIKEELTRGFSKSLKSLSKNTAGFNILFKTNSSSIHLKWKLDDYKVLWNMTPLAVNGIDLYGWNGQQWQFISSARPSDVINSSTLIENLDMDMRRYRIYLPLYTGVNNIEIGVDNESDIETVDDIYIPKKSIVIYGSSITQGASASRPGMTFSSLLGRNLNLDIINLGFSGNGKMEPEMANILSQIETDLFILDCVPNPSVKQIEDRTIPFVERLRKSNPKVPILMVESVFRENGYWNHKKGKVVNAQNAAFRKAFESLKRNGIGDIFYLNNDNIIGHDHEGTIDGVHFNDLGHMRMADRLSSTVSIILGLRNIRN